MIFSFTGLAFQFGAGHGPEISELRQFVRGLFCHYVTCTLLAFAAMEPKALYRGDSTPCWLGGITGLIYLASPCRQRIQHP